LFFIFFGESFFGFSFLDIFFVHFLKFKKTFPKKFAKKRVTEKKSYGLTQKKIIKNCYHVFFFKKKIKKKIFKKNIGR
jgi:hypothetical protein